MKDKLSVTLVKSDKDNPNLIVTRSGWVGVYNVVTENAESIYELLIGKRENAMMQDKLEKLLEAKDDLETLQKKMYEFINKWNPLEERTELERIGIDVANYGLQTIGYLLGVMKGVSE